MNSKRWKIIVMAVLFAFLMPVETLAQEGDAVRLDETGTVTLTSQEAAREEVSSLQIGLRVDSAEGEKVEFIFADSNAKISEFRYDEGAKQWNLYLAGTEALFAKGSDTLTLGRVVVLDGSGRAAAATVSVAEDSVKYVYGTELRSIGALKLPEPVRLNEQEDSGEDDGEDDPGWDDEEDDPDWDDGPDQDDTSDEEDSGNEGVPDAGDGSGGGGSQIPVSTPEPSEVPVSTPKPSEVPVSTPKPSGGGSQASVSTPKPSGGGSQVPVSTPKPSGGGNQGTTGSTGGNEASVSTPKPSGGGNQGIPGSGEGSNQGTGSGSLGDLSTSPTSAPQEGADGAGSPSPSVQPTNGEATDSDKEDAGINWVVLIVLILAVALAIEIAVMVVTVRRRKPRKPGQGKDRKFGE